MRDTADLTRRLAGGAAWAQVSRLAEVFSSLVLSLLLVRALGPLLYGEYSFVVNAATFGAVLLSLGYAESLMRFVSGLLGEGALEAASRLTRRLLVTRLATYAGGILLFALLHGLAVSVLHLPLLDRFWVPVVILLVSQGAIDFATSYSYARQRSRDVAVARTVGQVLALAFFVVIVVLKLADPVTAAITVSISYLGAVALLVFRGLGSALLPGPAGSRPTLALPAIAGFALAAWGINLFALGLGGQIDVILISALRRSAEQIAFYSVATLVFVKLGVLLSGWAGTAISSFAELRARRSATESNRLFLVYIRLHLLLSMLVYPPIILLSDPITRYLFGSAYQPAAILMKVYGAFWLFSAWTAATIPLSALYALGGQRTALAIRGVTGALNVVLDVALIPPLGAMGAVLATGVANGIAHLLDYVVAARRLGVGYPIAFLARLVVASLPAAAVVLLLDPAGLLCAVIGGVLYLAIFGAAILILHPLERGDVELIGRLSPRAAYVATRLAR